VLYLGFSFHPFGESKCGFNNVKEERYMPIFEYMCGSCGEEFELLVRSSEQEKSCPKCGGKELKRAFSTFAVSEGGGSSPACADGSCNLDYPASCPTCNLN
jgi:putative FmdB family regulatory protein